MSAPFKPAYNINSEASHKGTNRQAAADEQVELHSAYCLILDDYKDNKWFFTKQLQARSPETDVIHRRYWAVDPNNPKSGGWDGSLHRAPGISADNILNTLQQAQQAGGVRNIIEQIYCEPSVHRDHDDLQGLELRDMLRLMVNCIKAANVRGMRVAIDIGQPVTWMQDEIDDGFYDELLDTFARAPQHFISVHEYGLGDLWENISAIGMSTLSIDGEVNYPTDALPTDLLQKLYVAHPSEAHLGHVELMAQRCRKIGVPMPKTVYTELGWDRTRISQQSAVDRINGREAMGYPTLTQYWRTRYPQWSAARTAFEQVKWVNRAVPDYIVGVCLFGKDTSFENGAYHIEDSEFHGYLRDYSAQVRAGNPPQPVHPPIVIDARPIEAKVDELLVRVKDLEARVETLEAGK